MQNFCAYSSRESNASVELTPQREKALGSSTRRRLSKASSDKRHVVQMSGSDVDASGNCPFDTAVSVQLQRAVRRRSVNFEYRRISLTQYRTCTHQVDRMGRRYNCTNPRARSKNCSNHMLEKEQFRNRCPPRILCFPRVHNLQFEDLW